jgi:hypothetical protein
MVWETSPPLVVASTGFRLFRALLPLAMLWVSKLIIDGVVAWITRHSGNLVGIWKLVAFSRKTFSSFSPWSRPLGRRRTPFPRRARSGRDSSSAMWGSPTRDATGWLSKTLTLRCITMKS